MVPEGPATRLDPVLTPFVMATDPAESDRLLEGLLWETARPIIREIVHSHLSVYAPHAGRVARRSDVDDLTSEVVVKLVKRLRECKGNPSDKGIYNFRGYVARAAQNTCDEYFRRKSPERHRLKNKLRYILTHRRELALWEGEDHQRWCGLAAWQGPRQSVAPECIRQLQNEPSFIDAWLPRLEASRLNPTDLVQAVLNRAGGPCQFEDLVSLFADLLGIREQEAVHDAELENRPDSELGSDHDLADGLAFALDRQALLRHVWTEICELPPRQRAALLLNLRDPRGCGVIVLLPLVRVASLRQIAVALEMQAEKLATIWPELPWEDAAIARLLGVTRQQVINLRKSARERLARRLARPVRQRKVLGAE